MMSSGWSVRNISIDLGWSSYSTVKNEVRTRDDIASDNEMNDLYN